LGRAFKVTDELFDLSTMAMEYFKEHIEPTLPEITYFGAEFLDFATPFTSELTIIPSNHVHFDYFIRYFVSSMSLFRHKSHINTYSVIRVI
jgi:hypothetical protein